MTERRIKDLSFALEALSRVNSYAAVELRDKVERLLTEEIEVARRQQDEREQVSLPANTSSADDEIPF